MGSISAGSDTNAPVSIDLPAIPVAFARVLRNAGIRVPVGATVSFAQALEWVGVSDRDAVYWAGYCTMLRRPEDRGLYDEVFTAFWEHFTGGAPEILHRIAPVAIAVDDPDTELDCDSDDDGSEDPDHPLISVRWSDHEVLKQRDFAELSAAEFVEAADLLSRLRMTSAPQRSRRLRRSHAARHGRPDVQRTVRHALRTEGEPFHRYFRERSSRPRRVVLLLDVSGSMEPYARAFVRFVHASVLSRKRVEVFAIGTRLTRITRELQSRDPDAAIRSVARRVVDWSGGTRLGDGLRSFNDQWGVRGMARGADVVILSDGWDRGNTALLGEQMQRLQRVAQRTIWVNPLKASDGYAPLAQGMAAALPYIDVFVEGHSLLALSKLADVIGARS